jgi:hypothetical protein
VQERRTYWRLWRRTLWVLATWPLLAQAEPAPTIDAIADAPYADRLIDGGTTAMETFYGESYVTDPSGLPRSARLELVGSYLTHGDLRQNESGLLLGGQLATENYGTLALEGALRAQGGSTATLWQRGLPFDNGWWANNGLGVLNAPSIDVFRNQQRFYLPTWTLGGLSTEWRAPNGVQLVASAGTPGLLTGIRVPEFERLAGTTYTLGGQWSPNGSLNLGAQFAAANNATVGMASNANAPLVSSQTLVAGASWRNTAIMVQGNMVAGGTGKFTSQGGAWIDAAIAGPMGVRHTAGLFRMDPYLTWANQAIASDLQGAYYRAAYQDQRWSADGGIDVTRSVSRQGEDIAFATTNVRYQYSRDLGFGGGGNFRHTGDNAGSLFTYVDHAQPWMTGHVQLDLSRDRKIDDAQLIYNQTWSMPTGLRLGTMVGLGRTATSEAGTVKRVTAGVFGGGDIANNLVLDGNVNWTHGAGAVDATSLYANIALAWRFAPNWSLTTTYYASNANSWTPPLIQSPLDPPTVLSSLQRDRSVFLSLRHDFAAGSPWRPVSGAVGGGAGSVHGLVYLDSNDNGHIDAGEQGAPNLTVVIDGRFSVRTDSQGRFEFPAVGPGLHMLIVMEDNLQLPWVLKNEGKVDVHVRVRDDTRVEIPAQRQR